jgi:predicted ATPase/DNA-binding SARP family transcriptional activator/tRNA A-37 threonylcarbamoyl transferase component Bud32
MSKKLALYTFGGWRIEQDGEIDTAVGSRKVEALFVYLAVTARPHPRELLAELLWDDRSQKVAMSNLRRVLTGLRQHFGDYVTITRETAVLQANPNLWLDTHELQTKLAPLTKGGQPLTAEVVAAAEAALTWYQGEFLAGFTVREASGFEGWLTAEREHWQQQVLTALTTLSQYYEAAQLFPHGIAVAQRALQIDALQETAHQQLMRLLTLNGRRSEALTQYESCRQLLWDELGVTPVPETENLYQAIMAGGLTAVSVQPPLVEGRRVKVEERRVKGEERADRPSSPPRHNLPPQATPFIGREKELESLHQLIADPNTRLITIVGSGGMGKTRLGLAVAEQLLKTEQFPNGLFFVNLTPISEARYIVQTLADALDYQLSGGDGRSAQQQLLNYLRHKKMLLLFDNFEHLLDGGELLVDILQTAPEVKILVTSRERLHLRMEQVYPIEGLEFPDGETASPNVEDEDAAQYTAVKLFLQSARRNQPDFTLRDGDDFTHLVHVCQIVVGMPLALELAASWVDILPLSEIAAELQQGLDFLETDMRDMPERHRSIRAAIEHSWQKLDEQERDIFAKLSVFRGSFTLEAAKTIAGANLRQLARLVSKSLLQFNKEQNRYGTHELLRQFGEEKLEAADQLVETRAAYTDYFLTFLYNREADLKGRRQLAACAEIQAEFEGIRIAWNWAIQDKKFELLDKALNSLAIYSDRERNYIAYLELQQQVVIALAPTADEEPHPVWFRCVSRHLRPREKEIPLIEKALAYARQQNDLAEIAHCLNFLAWAKLMTDNLNGVLLLLEEALTIAHQLDDRFQIAELLISQGTYYQLSGQIDRAVGLYQQTQDLAESQGDKIWSARARQELCRITLWDIGDFVRAQADYSQVIAFYKQIGRHSVVAYHQVYLGYLTFLSGELAEAERLAQAAWAVLSESGDKLYEAHVRYLKGLLAIGRKNYLEAVHLYQEKVYLHDARSEEKFLHAWGSAMIAYGLGNLNSMQRQLYEAIDFIVTPPKKGMMVLVLPVVALFFSRIDKSERAVELLALTHKHLMGMMGWLEKAVLFSDLRPKLEAVCGADLFASAWQRGQELDLVQTAESLLSELTVLGRGEEAKEQGSRGAGEQGRFVKEALLAKGGFGEVYRGRDMATEQAVVIKRLKPELVAQQPDVVARFVREGELLRQLNHPNIVRMIAVEEVDGEQCLIMEYVAGGSLRDLLNKEGRLSVARTLDIALELADALSRAHHLDIIHRDLKPGNVLLAEDGTPRLTDFGIARITQREGTQLTQAGAIVGTMDYMSPEACQGLGLDGRSDIWSFGILLYEMLTGTLPFQGKQITATILAIISAPTPDLLVLRPDVPAALVRLIERMLVKDPADRLSQMRQVAADLERIRKGL